MLSVVVRIITLKTYNNVEEIQFLRFAPYFHTLSKHSASVARPHTSLCTIYSFISISTQVVMKEYLLIKLVVSHIVPLVMGHFGH